MTDSVIMFQNSKNKAEAFKFLDFLFQPKQRIKFTVDEGFLPVTKAEAEDKYFTENANLKVFRAFCRRPFRARDRRLGGSCRYLHVSAATDRSRPGPDEPTIEGGRIQGQCDPEKVVDEGVAFGLGPFALCQSAERL